MTAPETSQKMPQRPTHQRQPLWRSERGDRGRPHRKGERHAADPQHGRKQMQQDDIVMRTASGWDAVILAGLLYSR
jgi:hypothetical protein